LTHLTASPLAPTTRPLSHALLTHALARRTPARRDALQRVCAAMAAREADALETEIHRVTLASGRDLPTCLRDLDQFNALTPETENDAWYERPEAFTSMQLDALMPGFAQRRLQCTRDQVMAHAQPALQALEIGCGSGYLSSLLLEAAPDAHLTLLDRSAAAVRFVTAYHAARGSGGRVHCAGGDLVSLPAPDASMDGVIAAEVLEHAHDPQASTTELLRVLRPGGWFALSLPIDLDIAMHPTVFHDQAQILAFFGGFGLDAVDVQLVRPDPALDAICDVFPDFAGCLNVLFRKPGPPA